MSLRGKLRVVGLTDTGKVREHNEDTIAVDPDMSQNTSVASFRRSATGAISETPHMPQKRNPSGFSAPHSAHASTTRV